MANLIDTTQRMFDVLDAPRPAVTLCEECLLPVEPLNEAEMLEGGRGDTDLCRACFDFAALPVCEHRCPECGDTFACWGVGCALPERALCPDCNHGRGKPLPCGHLPGACVRYEWQGRLVCSVEIGKAVAA